MTENINGISITGGKFENKTDFCFFKKEIDSTKKQEVKEKEIRLCLLYGKNGSGKSTISRAFQKIKDSNVNINIEASLLFEDEIIDHDSNISEKIFVFNDDFINKNIRINKKGLNSIAIFGEQIEIDDIIKRKQADLTKLKEKKNSKDTEKSSLEEKNNKSSHIHFIEKIIALLKEKWAVREKEVKSNITASKVKDETIDKVIGFKSQAESTTLDLLKQDFENKIDSLNSIRSNSSEKFQEIPFNKYPFYDIIKLQKLLNKPIKLPELSDYDNFRKELMKDQGYENIRNYFTNDDHKFCPFCTQEVSPEHKKLLFSLLDTILNDEVNQHKTELENLKINSYDGEIPLSDSYPQSIKDEIKNVNHHITIYMNAIVDVNNSISKKQEDFEKPISLDFEELETQHKQLLKSLYSLNNSINQYNESIGMQKELINTLLDINSQMAYFEIRELYGYYSDAKDKYDAICKEIDEINFNIKQLEDGIRKLESKKNNTRIACDRINSFLANITTNKSKLSIDYEDNNYFIKSMNKNVSPKNISTGETNIIALCYFFSLLMENKDIDKLYNDEYFILLDDPVSSFDKDNRIGILFFLSEQIQLLLNNNPNTKVLLMSHDNHVILGEYFYNLNLITKRIKDDNSLEDFSIKTYNEYSELLNHLYHYADNNHQSKEREILSYYVGNASRRVVEAYFTFLYRTGLNDILSKKNNNVIDKITDSNIREYYKNKYLPAPLNEESHKGNKIKLLSFDLQITDNQKVKIVKDILCLMYLLDSEHINKHLPGTNETFKRWIKELNNENSN